MHRIKGLFGLLRIELPLSAGICSVMGQLLALGEFPPIYLSLCGFLSVFLISASILVSNDYYDLETDRINTPDRPIPSKLVTPAGAFRFSVVLLIGGLLLSYLIGIMPFLISAGLAVTGFLYNRYLKKSGLPGNLMVSFSVGMTFIYGGATVGLPFNKIALFFGLIAALIDLGEEIAADAMDARGDLIIDSKSLAIRYGRSTALKISCLIFLSAVLLTSIPFLLKWFPIIYLIPVIIMNFFIVFPAIRLLKSEDQEGRIFIRWIYLGATFGILLFLIMRLIGL